MIPPRSDPELLQAKLDATTWQLLHAVAANIQLEALMKLIERRLQETAVGLAAAEKQIAVLQSSEAPKSNGIDTAEHSANPAQ